MEEKDNYYQTYGYFLLVTCHLRHINILLFNIHPKIIY